MKAGKKNFTNKHIFDPAKKITKIETIIVHTEWDIMQINFYHHEERLVAVGLDDVWVK